MACRVNSTSLGLTLLTETVLSVNGFNNVVFDDGPAFWGAANAEEPTTPATTVKINNTTITFLGLMVTSLT